MYDDTKYVEEHHDTVLMHTIKGWSFYMCPTCNSMYKVNWESGFPPVPVEEYVEEETVHNIHEEGAPCDLSSFEEFIRSSVWI
jgi:hypothetical protein